MGVWNGASLARGRVRVKKPAGIELSLQNVCSYGARARFDVRMRTTYVVRRTAYVIRRNTYTRDVVRATYVERMRGMRRIIWHTQQKTAENRPKSGLKFDKVVDTIKDARHDGQAHTAERQVTNPLASVVRRTLTI